MNIRLFRSWSSQYGSVHRNYTYTMRAFYMKYILCNDTQRLRIVYMDYTYVHKVDT